MTTSTKYVFSSLSESSLYMAGSISDSSADISFTNIPSDTTGIGYLTDLAKERGYTLQNSDINAVIASLEQNNILYHNHEANGVVYRYPRIQYKRLHQKAAIVCVNEGVEAIHELFSLGNFLYHIGKREEEMLIQSIDTFETDLDFCDEMRGYRLRNWLPLNSENYKEYQSLERLADKVVFLEEKLIGNLLSLFSSIHYHVDHQIELSITSILNQRVVKYKNVKLMAFDVEFKVNMNLPSYIGLGKSVSIGFGTLTRNNN